MRLRHPNILEIFDLCYCENSAFLTMEYLDAQDLHKLINAVRSQGQSIPIPVAIYIVSQIALGLHAAHELTTPDKHPLNLVHRDISPENILFGSDGSIKLADFGIAKTSQMPDITPQDEIKGKFNYMSPEQAWGDHVDRRSDIFSLGIVLYETILGQGIYPYTSVADIIQHARVASFRQPHEIRPDFPADLERILLKTLDLDKNDRYQTALEFKIALDNCVAANHWNMDRAEWRQYLGSWIPFPQPPLPHMHAGEIAPDASSILKPEVTASPISEDLCVTGQVSSVMLNELRQIAGYPSAPKVPSVEKLSADLAALPDPETHEDTIRTACPPNKPEPRPSSESLVSAAANPPAPAPPPALSNRDEHLRLQHMQKVAFIIVLILLTIFAILLFAYIAQKAR